MKKSYFSFQLNWAYDWWKELGALVFKWQRWNSDETFSNIFNHCVPLQSLLLCMHNDFYRMLFQNREGMERGNPLRSTVYRKGLFHLMNETINPGIISKPFSLALPYFILQRFSIFFFYIYWVSQQVFDENFQWKSQFKRSKNWAR